MTASGSRSACDLLSESRPSEHRVVDDCGSVVDEAIGPWRQARGCDNDRDGDQRDAGHDRWGCNHRTRLRARRCAHLGRFRTQATRRRIEIELVEVREAAIDLIVELGIELGARAALDVQPDQLVDRLDLVVELARMAQRRVAVTQSPVGDRVAPGMVRDIEGRGARELVAMGTRQRVA